MSIGNVVGSNIANLLLILGVSSIIQSIHFQRETRLIEIPVCLAITVVFMMMCNLGKDITRLEGIILIVLFLLFIGYTILMAFKGEEFDKEGEVQAQEEENLSHPLKDLFSIFIGVLALKIGGDFVVDNAVKVAEIIGLSEKIISVTILAVGTSLPELVTSVSAAMKGKSDIAIGNIIGSCIFNMLLIIGVSAIIHPITYNISYNKDLAILVVGTLILALFPAIPPKNEMSRMNGIIYFCLYCGYMMSLFFV